MSREARLVSTAFSVGFAVSPGSNHVNRVQTAMGLGTMMNVWLRRGIALLPVGHGVALGTAPTRA